MDTFTHTKTINVHTLTITDEEIVNLFEDPEPLLEKMRELLDGNAPEHLEPVLRNVKTVRRKKIAHRSPRSSTSYEKQACPDCGRMISAQQMNRHFRSAHPAGHPEAFQS